MADGGAPTRVRREYSLTIAGGDPPRESVWLEFGLKRSLLRAAGAIEIPGGLTSFALQASASRLIATWSPPLPPGARFLFFTEAEGEPLDVARVQWTSDAGARPGVLDPQWNQQLIASAAAARRAAAGALDDAGDNAACSFFSDLDHASHPELVIGPAYLPVVADDPGRRLADLGAVMPELIRRIHQRRTQQPPLAARPLLLQAVCRLSELQVTLMQRYFSHDASLDLDSLGDAYRKFAAGWFANDGLLPNNEPDSARVFCFAEFALLALQARDAVLAGLAAWPPLRAGDAREQRAVDWLRELDCWSSLLPALLSMQDLYLACYPLPAGAPRAFEGRGTALRIKKGDGINAEKLLSDMKDKYANKDLNELLDLAQANAIALCGDDPA